MYGRWPVEKGGVWREEEEEVGGGEGDAWEVEV